MTTSFVSAKEIKRLLLASAVGVLVIIFFNYQADLYSFKRITEGSVNNIARNIPEMINVSSTDLEIMKANDASLNQLFDNTVMPEKIITANITDYSCNVIWTRTFSDYKVEAAPCERITDNITHSSWLSPLGSYQNLFGGKSVFVVKSPFHSEKTGFNGILEIYFDTSGFSSLWFTLRVIKVSFASIVSMSVIASFLLIFKKRSEELTNELNVYSAIVKESPLGIYTIDQKGIIDTFNQKMTLLAGAKSPSEVIGLNALSISSYQASGLDKYFKKGLAGEPFNIETPYVSHTANKKTYRRYWGSPIFSEDKTKVEKLLLIVEDITERKELEEAKRDFIAIASHEMRTPLTIIRGAAERIMKKLPIEIDAEVNLMINHIHDSSIRMLDIVNSFLDVGRLEDEAMAFNIEIFDINDLISDVMADLGVKAESKNLYLKTNFIKRSVNVRADKARTREIIFNLIANAIQYTKTGGLTIQTSFFESFVKINFIDTGIGVPEDMRETIFQKFRSVHKDFLKSKEYGSGMGLFISKMLAENMNGRLYLESSVIDKGSVFTLLLPFSK